MLPAKFLQRIMPIPESGCWAWMGGRMKNGYGVFSLQLRKTILAHRFAYEALRGPIPHGLQLDHLCRVRCCVNPDHLECVTRRENILRGVSPAAHNARQTHCALGHPLSNDNLIRDDGHRRCLTCRMAYEHKRNLRRYTPKIGRIHRAVKTGRNPPEVEAQRRIVLERSLALTQATDSSIV